MRLNNFDILEQCFRNKLFGYNRDDVDTFLHLVADDFKEIAEELELLKKKLAQNNQTIEKLKEDATQQSRKTGGDALNITPDIMREKAKRIINAAREHASQHKRKAEQELSVLKREINKIKQENQEYLSQQKEVK